MKECSCDGASGCQKCCDSLASGAGEEVKPLYGHHEADYEKYGEWFARHMDRMTAEQLDGKAEIAWELAYRDHQLHQAECAIRELLEVTEHGSNSGPVFQARVTAYAFLRRGQS